MSQHQEWKMIHLLYQCALRTGDGAHRVLTEQELTSAGVHCDADSRLPLEESGVVERIGDAYTLSRATRKILEIFTVAKGPEKKQDIRVDYPEAFLIMPFGESWSDNVFTKFFTPAIEDGHFIASRGDSIVRVGDLSTNIWRSITQAGVIIAEVSAPNPNVYYELGLADALGKPVFLFKQESATLPADFSGIHFYNYNLANLSSARHTLTKALLDWAYGKDNQFFGVKALVDR